MARVSYQFLSHACVAVAMALSMASATAQIISVDSLPPMSWIERHLPENLPKLKYPEYADALDQVRMQIHAGRYKLALQSLQRKPAPQSAAWLELRAQALLESGQNKEAIDVLRAPELQGSPRAQRMLAEALAASGSRQEAIALLTAAIGAFPSDAALRLELAATLESVGQLNKAREALEWFKEQSFLEQWRKGERPESADDIITIARGLDRLAVLTGQYRDDLGLHQDVLSMFVYAYDVVDRRNAAAHVAAAQFYMDHDDQETAGDELKRALTINPSYLSALKLMGEVALANYDFDSCEKAIALIRKVNAEHPAASLLSASLLLLQRMPDEAQSVLARLLETDPDSADILAHYAACQALRFDAQALATTLADIDRKMPESSLAHTTAANYLIPAFQFKDAADLLQEAMERTPHWNTPRNLLALSYMQQADMTKARPVLEDARKLDPFNVETTNYLRLLDTIDSYKVIESDHFLVRFSPAKDPFLAEEVLQYMEAQYARIAGAFAHEPDTKTIIELMPTSEDFAVRTTGKPWIGTIGASTGPVITMVSPRSFGQTNGTFDWCDVARHEFTHTVTLNATHHRIPRWFTEGLAVAEQTDPLNYEQATRLSSAVLRGRLFPVRRLNWAFVRPQRRDDTPLAYAQSLWLCSYIKETFGYQTILDMFAAYRSGKQTDQVISDCLKMSTTQLDDRFAKWAADRVVKIGMDSVSQKQLAELKTTGEKHIADKDLKAALVTWQKAYSICALDPLVNTRLAGLYLHKSINQPQKAATHLHALDCEQLHDNRYALRLAKLYAQQSQYDQAILSARRATQIDPYDAAARDLLAGIYQKAGKPEQADVQTEISATILSLKKR